MTKNVRICVALLAIALLYTFVLGCDDTAEPITASVEGTVEDWYVTGLDSAVENVAAPVLAFGDAMVDIARDTGKATIEWGFDSTTGGQ